MPHSREVRPTSHADHDPILVVALAAGDLAAIDRDLAADLVRSCPDCALLHDDLIALTRATQTVPPPYVLPARDFRLTPADVARLRPAGWRRFADALSRPRSGLSRNLGVGLATLGLAGLLVGNVQINFGSAAATPAAITSAGGAAAGQEAAPDATTRGQGATTDLGAQPAASGAPAFAPTTSVPDPYAAASTPASADGNVDAAVPAASGGKTAQLEAAPGDSTAATNGVLDEPTRPLNLVFGGAIVVGLVLVAASLLRRRRSA